MIKSTGHDPFNTVYAHEKCHHTVSSCQRQSVQTIKMRPFGVAGQKEYEQSRFKYFLFILNTFQTQFHHPSFSSFSLTPETHKAGEGPQACNEKRQRQTRPALQPFSMSHQTLSWRISPRICSCQCPVSFFNGYPVTQETLERQTTFPFGTVSGEPLQNRPTFSSTLEPNNGVTDYIFYTTCPQINMLHRSLC